MSELARKLQIKPGNRVLLQNAPEGCGAALEPLPEGATVTTAARGEADVVLAFARDSKELGKLAPKAMKAVREGGILWMAYPKRTSGLDTDLTRDAGWKVVDEAGWGAVAQVAIDATWSAVRFKPGAARPRSAAPARAASNGARPAIEAPPDLAEALASSDDARALWEALSYSHRKEHVGYIEEAKRPETRARRVAKTVEMLASGTRDRNAKYRG